MFILDIHIVNIITLNMWSIQSSCVGLASLPKYGFYHRRSLVDFIEAYKKLEFSLFVS